MVEKRRVCIPEENADIMQCLKVCYFLMTTARKPIIMDIIKQITKERFKWL